MLELSLIELYDLRLFLRSFILMGRARITSDNLTPLIQIITWFCLIISVICFLARGATKSVLVHKFNLDDVLIILSIVCLHSFYNQHSKLHVLIVNSFSS